jgi:hypothetical protein
VELTHEVVEVTPQVAEEWLATMAVNRNVSESNLDAYMKDMRDGRWHMDGAPIRFNTKNELIDGQHRLLSVMKTGITQKFLVVRGVQQTAMSTMDTGKARSKADILAIFDPTLPNVNALAAVAVAHKRWKEGHRGATLRNAPVSNDALIEHVIEWQGLLIEASRMGKRLTHHFPAFTSQGFALADALFQEFEPEDRAFFWERLMDGAGLDPGNPILALREYLIREGRSRGVKPRVRIEVAVALIIKAWNAYRDGRDIRLLAYKVGGANPERFPEPV